MKRLHLLGIALVAVCSFGVLSAASTSAAVTLLALWLVSGTEVTAELLVESTAVELLLEDNRTLAGVAVDILCSGTLDGFVGSNGADLITELLNLSNGGISTTLLSGEGLLCEDMSGGLCKEPLVWAIELPWNTLLELIVDPLTGTEEFFVVLITPTLSHVGWYVWCMNAIGEKVDECTAPEGILEAKNEAGVIDATFSEAFAELMEVKLATCTEGAAVETGVVEGLGTIKLSEAGMLEVASE